MKEEDRPEDFCPNCWGTQAYDGQYKEMLRDEQIDVNNHQAKRAFISKFANTYLSGIKLINRDEKLYCPKCNKYVT